MNSVTHSTSEVRAADEDDLFSVSPKSLTREELCVHCEKVAVHCEYTYGDMREYLKENEIDAVTAKYVLKYLQKKHSHRLRHLVIMAVAGVASLILLGVCVKYGFLWKTSSGSYRHAVKLSPYAWCAILTLYFCFSRMLRLFSSRIKSR